MYQFYWNPMDRSRLSDVIQIKISFYRKKISLFHFDQITAIYFFFCSTDTDLKRWSKALNGDGQIFFLTNLSRYWNENQIEQNQFVTRSFSSAFHSMSHIRREVTFNGDTSQFIFSFDLIENCNSIETTIRQQVCSQNGFEMISMASQQHVSSFLFLTWSIQVEFKFQMATALTVVNFANLFKSSLEIQHRPIGDRRYTSFDIMHKPFES